MSRAVINASLTTQRFRQFNTVRTDSKSSLVAVSMRRPYWNNGLLVLAFGLLLRLKRREWLYVYTLLEWICPKLTFLVDGTESRPHH